MAETGGFLDTSKLLRGDDLTEWRAHVKLSFVIDRVQEG